jgi:hypothetical protein
MVFLAKAKSATIGIVTDLGRSTHLIQESFKDIDAILAKFKRYPTILIDELYLFFSGWLLDWRSDFQRSLGRAFRRDAP